PSDVVRLPPIDYAGRTATGGVTKICNLRGLKGKGRTARHRGTLPKAIYASIVGNMNICSGDQFMFSGGGYGDRACRLRPRRNAHRSRAKRVGGRDGGD